MAVAFKLRKKKTDSLNFASEAEMRVSPETLEVGLEGSRASWNSSLGNGKGDGKNWLALSTSLLRRRKLLPLGRLQHLPW